MVQLNYDFSQTAPSSGGGRMFPPSDQNGWLVQITNEQMKAMSKGQGSRLVFQLIGMEGSVSGQSAESGYNVDHPNGETVRIAFQELAAIGWACGALRHGQTFVGDTSQFFNKPFRIIVAPQTQNPQYNEIVGYRTPDGQDPAKLFSGAANGPTHGAGQPQGGMPPGNNPNAGAPQGGGFGGQPQGQPQGGGWNGGGAPQGGQPPQGQGQPGGQQAGFGGAPQGGQQGGGAGWGGQPQGGQPQGQNPGGWGGGNPQGGQPQGGQGGGWNGGGGQNAGGWGNQ